MHCHRGEKKGSQKVTLLHHLCFWIGLSSESTTLCVYSFNLYYVNEPVKCLESCYSTQRTQLHGLSTSLGER